MESSHLPNFINEDIKNFMEFASKDKNIKIVSCEINPNLQDISLSRKLRGGQEDEFYLENEYHRSNVRRGGSVYDINKTPIIARKGLQKFFYLKYSHISENAAKCNEGENKRKKKRKKLTDKDIKPIIFREVIEALLNQKKVIICVFYGSIS